MNNILLNQALPAASLVDAAPDHGLDLGLGRELLGLHGSVPIPALLGDRAELLAREARGGDVEPDTAAIAEVALVLANSVLLAQVEADGGADGAVDGERKDTTDDGDDGEYFVCSLFFLFPNDANATLLRRCM